MNFWLKLRIWFKVTVFAIVALYVLMFLIFNHGTRTEMWFYPGSNGRLETSVLLMAVGAFLLGVITTLLVRTILRTISQIREMKRRRLEKEAAAVVARAAKLRVREQQQSTQSRGFDVVQPNPDEPTA